MTGGSSRDLTYYFKEHSMTMPRAAGPSCVGSTLRLGRPARPSCSRSHCLCRRTRASSTSSFRRLDAGQRQLLFYRPRRVRARHAVRPGDVQPGEGHAGAQVDARRVARSSTRRARRTCSSRAGCSSCSRPSSRRASSTTSACCSTMAPCAVRHDHPVLGRRHPRLLRRGVVRHPHEHLREQPHGVRVAARQAARRSTRSRCRPA